MLLQLYPKVHRRYSSLPVFGPIVENFGAWLLKQGYSTDCIREHFCCMRRTARLLHKRGVGRVANGRVHFDVAGSSVRTDVPS
jgi:hypothetical protein